MFLLFFALWLLMAGEVTVSVCLWGGAASALLCWVCVRTLEIPLWLPKGSVGKLGAAVRYLGILIFEMLKAGWVVMRMVYTRGRDIHPKLIWFDTTLKTPLGQTVLADSITLTAGTITVLAEDGRFLVHTLDTSLAEGLEHSPFQQRLEKLEA